VKKLEDTGRGEAAAFKRVKNDLLIEYWPAGWGGYMF